MQVDQAATMDQRSYFVEKKYQREEGSSRDLQRGPLESLAEFWTVHAYEKTTKTMERNTNKAEKNPRACTSIGIVHLLLARVQRWSSNV